MVPDNAEAWYLLADQIFHYGSAMGIPDWEDKSLAGFKKAMELDSTYLPGYSHAMPLAPSMGDTAFFARALRLRSAADTSSYWRVQNDWYLAARRGDNTAADKIFANLGPRPDNNLNGIIRHLLFDGTGAAQAKSAVERFIALAPTDANRRGRARYAHDVMLDLGRPADASRYLAASKDSANDFNALIITVRDASLAQIPEQQAVEAVRTLSQYETRPDASDSAGRAVQRALVRVLEPWRIAHGDTSMTRRSLQRLRLFARDARNDPINTELEIAFVEMLHADAAHSPSLRRAVERLDSLTRLLDVASAPTSRLAQQAIVGARMWEKLGEPARALALVGRYAVWSTEAVPYLALQLREQGRIAARVGDRKRAIRAYEHYLGMRSMAEPSVMPQVDSVRRELAAVKGPAG
jgi:hypothetical protein